MMSMKRFLFNRKSCVFKVVTGISVVGGEVEGEKEVYFSLQHFFFILFVFCFYYLTEIYFCIGNCMTFYALEKCRVHCIVLSLDTSSSVCENLENRMCKIIRALKFKFFGPRTSQGSTSFSQNHSGFLRKATEGSV